MNKDMQADIRAAVKIQEAVEKALERNAFFNKAWIKKK